jgi:hypothetical protein
MGLERHLAVPFGPDAERGSMDNVNRDETDKELVAAYQTLARKRDSLLSQRENIDDEINRLDTALNALIELVDLEHQALLVDGRPENEHAADDSVPSPPPVAQSEADGRKEPRKRDISRRIRMIEVLLERPDEWLTVAEVADLTEGQKSTMPQRNAISEALRRLLRQQDIERDGSQRPVRYKAIPASLRSRLVDSS